MQVDEMLNLDFAQCSRCGATRHRYSGRSNKLVPLAHEDFRISCPTQGPKLQVDEGALSMNGIGNLKHEVSRVSVEGSLEKEKDAPFSRQRFDYPYRFQVRWSIGRPQER